MLVDTGTGIGTSPSDYLQGAVIGMSPGLGSGVSCRNHPASCMLIEGSAVELRGIDHTPHGPGAQWPFQMPFIHEKGRSTKEGLTFLVWPGI